MEEIREKLIKGYQKYSENHPLPTAEDYRFFERIFIYIEKYITCKEPFVEKRFKCLFTNILLCLENPDKLCILIRNLALILSFLGAKQRHPQNIFVPSYQKFKRIENSPSAIYRKYGITCLFSHYVKNSIVNQHLIILLKSIDFAFTPNIEKHLHRGFNFVPCISLFKKYNARKKTGRKVSKESWLVLVYKYIAIHSVNSVYVENNLHSVFQMFLQVYGSELSTVGRLDYFCTVIISVLDDMELISCRKNNYQFVVTMLHMVASVIGKPTLLDEIKQSNHFKCLLQCTDNLDLNCYALIALKSNEFETDSEGDILPEIDNEEDIVPVTQYMISLAPKMYQYEPLFFGKGESGILSQLFLHAAGVNIKIPRKQNIFVVKAEHLFYQLPYEWRNLNHVFDSNCNRENSNTANDVVFSNTNTDKSSYFYISSNDVYTVLYYISKTIFYYMEVDEFEDEFLLYSLYDDAIQQTVLACTEDIDSIEDVVEKIISAINVKLHDLQSHYVLPDGQMLEFSFFLQNKINGDPVLFFTPDKNFTAIKYCGKFFPSGDSCYTSGISLIIYLSTILQVENMLRLKMNTVISEVKFLDEKYYQFLLYTLAPKNKCQSYLHAILQNYPKMPHICLGLGILRMLSKLVSPTNPEQVLEYLVGDFCDECLMQNDYTEKGTLSQYFLVYLYFIFRKYEMLEWFCPCVMGTFYAYSGKLFPKPLPHLSFNCDQSFLLHIVQDKFETLFDSILEKQSHLQEDSDYNISCNQNINIFHSFQEMKETNLKHIKYQKLRQCDLFFYVLHLNVPLQFITLSFPYKKSNGNDDFEIYICKTL